MAAPVQAVERAFRILECFASSSTPLTIDAVAQETGLARATAYRLIHTLRSDGYLYQEGKSFRLGEQVLGLGFARLSRQGFARSAQVVLNQLATRAGQTVVLAEPSNSDTTNNLAVDEIVISAAVKTGGALSVVVNVGQQLYAADTVLGMPLESTSGDLTTHVGKHGAGGAVQAIAVPVLGQDGQPVASLAIVMPAGRMSNADLVDAFADLLQQSASQLGY